MFFFKIIFHLSKFRFMISIMFIFLFSFMMSLIEQKELLVLCNFIAKSVSLSKKFEWVTSDILISMSIKISCDARIDECIIDAFLALRRLTLKLTWRVMLNIACSNQCRDISKSIWSVLMFCSIVCSWSRISWMLRFFLRRSAILIACFIMMLSCSYSLFVSCIFFITITFVQFLCFCL